TFSLPALLAFPRQASLLIQADRTGRAAAMRTLEMVMTRLLTRVPAGRVRFTIIDPVGLGQNFAGFMHLADHDDQLVGGRIWTSQEHIEQRIADLTEHMETVIQKYLRNEFETIDDYNAQAGELAEPYRFLVIADFPVNFSQEAVQRLNSIASTGARCGVYTLISRDLRAPLPGNSHVDEIVAHSVNLVQQGEQLIWKDEVFERFPLSIDPPPVEESLTHILNTVGRYAKDANRVEVPFANIAPKPDQIWTGDATTELKVPIGRMGATRSQLLKLGRGVAQHVLMAGKTGSGKSTLLHVLITNLALWYHPDEVEFYLVDFKKGVEFKTYATHQLPHARAIAVESDREFGLSVLQRLDAELTRRGELYRKLGVQDLAAYREQSGLKMPRTLLIIDEFQEFFSEDDKLAQDAALLIDRLVRQGRAFGIHVLLGSQTIGGSGGLNRSTLGQMAVRVALQTSEADSQLILGDNNSAARLLSRPGEAIYNDQGGLVEGNSPFQISWLPDEEREEYLIKAQKRAVDMKVESPEPVVFEGNSPADITRNRKLGSVLSEKKWQSTASAAPTAWLGEPVAIKEPTAVSLRRQSGANVLVVGQQEEPAMAIMVSSLISLAAQQAPDSGAKFYIFDGTPADSPLAGTFNKLQAVLPQKLDLVEWRSTDEAINALAEEIQRRQDNPDAHPAPIFAFVFGLQRYRSLRKQEETFSYSASDEEKKPKPDKQFADLLREGPALGIHIFTWADTPAAVERTIDRASMREFDTRVLFQMSANDSSNLIDSPAANKLGFHRALAFSEEQGVLEKFRPYALPSKEWLVQVKAQLSAKT
ncbi:MAG: cell division protein FtsK, partial [Anaerolineae bacterium]|nr:cell division protein FtsK [Phycisphaerae bacterium]